MKSSKALGVIAAAAFSVLSAKAASATVITNWNFSTTVTAPDNSPAPLTGSGTATSLGMTNSFTYGGGETTPTATNDDVTSVATTAFGNQDTWRIRGTNNKKGSPGNGWNNSAPDYTQGAEFAVDTTGFNDIGFSFNWFATNQGVANMQVRYTTDGVNFTNFGSDILATPNDFFGGASATNPNITLDLSAIPGVANNPNFAIELVSVRPIATDANFLGAGDTNYAGASGGDYNNSSGNWSFNNISVTGTAVPEPASASLLGLAGLAILRRRRTR